MMTTKAPHFNGPDYDPDLDHERLTGQIKRIKDLMLDGEWRTLQEIAKETGDPESSISAQLRHLRKDRFGGWTVEKQRRGDPSEGLFEYRVLEPLPGSAPVGSTPTPKPSKPEFREAIDELKKLRSYLRKQKHPGFSDNLIKVFRWIQDECC